MRASHTDGLISTKDLSYFFDSMTQRFTKKSFSGEKTKQKQKNKPQAHYVCISIYKIIYIYILEK